MSEGIVEDDEELGGLGIDGVGNGFHCGLNSVHFLIHLPSVLIVYSDEGLLRLSEHGTLHLIELYMIESLGLWSVSASGPFC